MASKKLALLKWCGGLDDKTYTSGIPIEWIRNFDYGDYQSGESSSAEVYAIEWRDSRKPPKGGWKLYDAYVVQVSERRRVLDEKLRVLKGLVSPIKVITQNLTTSSKGKDKENEGQTKNSNVPKIVPKKKLASSLPTDSGKNSSKLESTKGRYKKVRRISTSDSSVSGARDEDISGINELPESHISKKNRVASATKGTQLLNVDMNEEQENTYSSPDLFDPGNNEDDVTPTTSSSPQNDNGEIELTNSCESGITTSVPSETITLEKVMNKLDAMSNQLIEIAQLLSNGQENSGLVLTKGARKILPITGRSRPGPSQPTHHNIHALKEGEFTEGDIEIGKPGSKVLVTDMQWATACSTNTYTAMTISLLQAVFPLETLLRSNYKGGASKLNKGEDDAGPVRQALDKHIIEAIKYSVRSQYPTAFKEGEFGAAINVKLNKLRRQYLK